MKFINFNHAFFRELATLSKLAWPLLVAQVTQTLMGVSDTIMSGRYSSIDMAAVAIGVSISLPLLIFVQGLCLALSPTLSRLDGANDTRSAAINVQQMLYLSLGVSLFALLVYLFLPHLLLQLDMSAQMYDETLAYLSYVFLAAPGVAVYQTMRNYCEGFSLTRPSMIIMFLGLLINIPANYVLINGYLGFPEMGGAGCGLSTMIVFYMMAVASVIYSINAKKLKPHNLFAKMYAPDITIMFKFIKLGVPIAMTLLFEVTLFAIVAIILAPFGHQTVAAHQIALNVSSLIFMLPLSIGLAVAIRIGFLIGEKRLADTKLAYYAALVLSLSTVLVTASSTFLFREEIASLYTNETALISVAASLLILASLFQLSDAIQVVSANALRGFNDTKAMFLISLFSYWGVGFTVGAVLGLSNFVVPKMTAAGFWIGFITGLSTAAVLLYIRLSIIQKRLFLSHQ